MNEDELRQTIERGTAAATLLSSEAFNTVVLELKDQYFNRWLSSNNQEEREKIHASALAIEDLVGNLVGRLSEAETAQAQLDQSNTYMMENYNDDD